MKANEDYYVYVYIDPRNYEQFYYGKGRGSRKKMHLKDAGKSRKARQIAAIKSAGCEPLIRVIARDLTSEQALLVEATLLWKLGKSITNEVAGHFSSKFRPHDSFHRNLPGFDFSRRVHLFNVGEAEHRSWDDCRSHGFLSAGYGARYRDQARQLGIGDIVVAYLKGYGYVGIGRVSAEAVAARDFRIGKSSLAKLRLNARRILHDSDDLERCEYVIRVKWRIAEDRDNAIWKSGLFATRLVRVSLDNQPKTRRFIEDRWNIRFEDLLAEQ